MTIMVWNEKCGVNYPIIALLRGSHGLSAKRAWRTLSSRSEGPQPRSWGPQGPQTCSIKYPKCKKWTVKLIFAENVLTLHYFIHPCGLNVTEKEQNRKKNDWAWSILEVGVASPTHTFPFSSHPGIWGPVVCLSLREFVETKQMWLMKIPTQIELITFFTIIANRRTSVFHLQLHFAMTC